jgi:predicted nuclease of predicted toxin-antitoxin system
LKLLLDSCVWGGAKLELEAAGCDVVWCGEWERDPGDAEILGVALRERHILVTLDQDFGELATLHGVLHTGILRLVGFGARRQAAACLGVLTRHRKELSAGAIITAEPGRLRIRTAGV